MLYKGKNISNTIFSLWVFVITIAICFFIAIVIALSIISTSFTTNTAPIDADFKVTPYVQQEETITATFFNIYRHKSGCDYVRTMSIIDDHNNRQDSDEIATSPSSSNLGKANDVNLHMDLEKDLKPGPATFFIKLSFKCPGNILHALGHPYVMTWHVPFTIVSNEIPMQGK